MNGLMPCKPILLEPEVFGDNDPRTEMEKRIEWLCDSWAEAQTDDTLESWRDVRMMTHGAIQALNFCHADSRHEDRMALMAIHSVAFEYSQACINEGKYEGATK